MCVFYDIIKLHMVHYALFSILCVDITIFQSTFAPGFGRCLTYTPSLIIVTAYFNKRRGLAVGMATAGVGLGMFLFPPLIGALFGSVYIAYMNQH